MCCFMPRYTYVTSSVIVSPQIARDISRCQPLWAIYTTMHNSVCGTFLDGLVSHLFYLGIIKYCGLTL